MQCGDDGCLWGDEWWREILSRTVLWITCCNEKVLLFSSDCRSLLRMMFWFLGQRKHSYIRILVAMPHTTASFVYPDHCLHIRRLIIAGRQFGFDIPIVDDSWSSSWSLEGQRIHSLEFTLFRTCRREFCGSRMQRKIIRVILAKMKGSTAQSIFLFYVMGLPSREESQMI